MKSGLYKKACLVLTAAWMIVCVSGLTAPRIAHAQYITADLTQDISGVGDWAEQIISTVNSVYSKLNTSVLGPLAWALAKALLQSITADIVNWINSGFQGSPAFVQNPEGLVLDSADQMTGEFIRENGPLQSLCSPWNIDVRLAIGLQQATALRDRYTCTLGTIIGNAKDANVNGYSVQGFLNGDFSQGGWPAFISMTTEPQNNPYGSYLQAESDLQSQIGQRQSSISSDILASNGFLSWQTCHDLPGTSLQAVSLVTGGQYVNTAQGTSTTVTVPLDVNFNGQSLGTNGNANGISVDPKTGAAQQCSTQTPGSFIASSLFKSAPNGQASLVVADSIDEVVSALFGQLVNTLLTGGLASASQESGSGATQSAIEAMRNDTTGTAFGVIGAQLAQETSQYIATGENVKSIRDQTVSAITDLGTFFGTVINYCQSVGDTGQAASDQTVVTGQIYPLLAQYETKDNQASSSVDKLISIQTEAAATTDTTKLNSLGQQYANLLSSGGIMTTQDVQNAKNDLNSVQQTISTLRAQGIQSQLICKQYSATNATGTSATSTPFLVPVPSVTAVDTSSGNITGQNFTYTTGIYMINTISTIRTNIYSFTVASDTMIHVDLGSVTIPGGNNSLYITNPTGTSVPFTINIPQ